MFNALKRTALVASVSLTALSGAAFAEQPAVSRIDVDSTLDAAQGSNAMMLYPEITTDLQTAIAEKVETSDDAGDPTIRVEITRVSLDGATMLPDSREFNELEGTVVYSDDNGEISAATFPVQVAAYTDDRAAPEGYVLMAPSDEDFYIAMLTTFADTVAELLPEEARRSASR